MWIFDWEKQPIKWNEMTIVGITSTPIKFNCVHLSIDQMTTPIAHKNDLFNTWTHVAPSKSTEYIFNTFLLLVLSVPPFLSWEFCPICVQLLCDIHSQLC